MKPYALFSASLLVALSASCTLPSETPDTTTPTATSSGPKGFGGQSLNNCYVSVVPTPYSTSTSLVINTMPGDRTDGEVNMLLNLEGGGADVGEVEVDISGYTSDGTTKWEKEIEKKNRVYLLAFRNLWYAEGGTPTTAEVRLDYWTYDANGEIDASTETEVLDWTEVQTSGAPHGGLGTYDEPIDVSSGTKKAFRYEYSFYGRKVHFILAE